MPVWLVRAGRQGEREALALEKSIAVVGWEDLPDLSSVNSRDEILGMLQTAYPDVKPKTLTNWQSQIWPFVREIRDGDVVALPLKSRSAIALGEVTGPYRYRPDLPPDARHTRSVKWRNEVARDAVDQDLLYSLGAFMTVCRIQRNDAEQRIRALMAGKTGSPPTPVSPEETDALIDIEEYARDRIRQYIGRRFAGHGLARVVAAVLEAQGYKVRVAPAGPDGGLDVIAGQGPMGFDPPKLGVQVKSGSEAVDTGVLHQLQGVLKNFGAERGLIVAWGGYKQSVLREAPLHYFEIRLWNADDLVQMICAAYDRLPPDLQAELPLKRIWTLVPPDE